MKPQGVEDKGEVMLTTAARSLDGGLDAVLTLDKQTYSPRHDYHIASRLSIIVARNAHALLLLCVCVSLTFDWYAAVNQLHNSQNS